MNPKEQKLAYSIKEAAEALGVSYHTIWRMVSQGRLKTIPGLRIKVIPKSEIEKLLTSAQ